MPTGLRRFQKTGQLHFVTFSCYRRLDNRGAAAVRDLFVSALERVCERYQWAVIGYVVTPEHVHSLVNEPLKGSLVKAIQALKLCIAPRRHERPFWQARSYDFNVWTAEKETEKLDLMHRNPVTRGLVAKPEDWQWSSFRHYATGAAGVVEIESEWTARWREQMGIRLSVRPGPIERFPP